MKEGDGGGGEGFFTDCTCGQIFLPKLNGTGPRTAFARPSNDNGVPAGAAAMRPAGPLGSGLFHGARRIVGPSPPGRAPRPAPGGRGARGDASQVGTFSPPKRSAIGVAPGRNPPREC